MMTSMIAAELETVYIDDQYTGKLPMYTVHLFHQFLNQKMKIIINWDDMDLDFMYHHPLFKCNLFGFKKFRPLFVTENGSGNLKTSSLINLCQNIKSLVVMSQTLEYIPSIALDDVFLSEILSSIKSLNERGDTKFKEFVIVSPSDPIQEFIDLNQLQFNQMGWMLTRKMYSNPERAGKAKGLWIIRD